jgi:tetratricopeptide (TPR) repeat protein
VQIATSYWNQRRYDDAIAWANKALALDPRHLLAREFLAGAYWKKGDLEQYLAENVRQATAFGCPENQLAAIRRGCETIAHAFDTGGWLAVTRYMLDQLPPQQPAAAIRLAILHGEVGDLDGAFAHLDRALEARDPAVVHLAVGPQWDSLRPDPRFTQGLARMRLQPTG